jgi:hypothetical protein
MSIFLAMRSVSIVLLSLGIGLADASGRTIDNISWNIIRNYQGTGETVCLAKNLNFTTVTASFDIYPAVFTSGHRWGRATATLVLPPYRRLPAFSWFRTEHKHSPSCTLKSWRY